MSAPKKYRKKPVVIEAMQWDGTAAGASDVIDWILAGGGTATYMCTDPVRCSEHNGDTPHSVVIRTLEGNMDTGLNDFVIRDIQGEFYPVKPDILEATYEVVSE